MFIREKKIQCGTRYAEVDIIPRTLDAERNAKRGRRSRKQQESAPKQKNLNDKNAKRYLIQLGNGNFGAGDLHVSCTYSNEYLPETVGQAEREVKNFLRRIEYRRRKSGLSALKYILVTEYKQDDTGSFIKRIHHHIIMNGGLDRDEIESIWSKPVKGHGRQSLGFVNADRIQPNENGIEALCRYITKDPQGKKRWSSSRNLKRPVSRTNDFRYSLVRVKKMSGDQEYSKLMLEKMYPKYEISRVEYKYYELTGWHIYIKMWLRSDLRQE